MSDSINKIRPETLRPATEWVQPTGEEVRELMQIAKITELGLAQFVGLKVKPGARGSRVVARWKSGENKIPYAAWALLAHRAGCGMIWVRHDLGVTRGRIVKARQTPKYRASQAAGSCC